MIESFFQDLRQSLRMFWQSRGFTAAAVAALALGIGANTAIFSVVNAVLLKPVPFPDPDRLVMLQVTSPQGVNGGGSPAKFMHYREQSQVLRDVAAFNTGVVNFTGGAFPEQLRSGRVSADFFRLFGAPVLRGRTFSPEEDRPDGDKVVVLSYGVWVRRFDSDPDVVGKTISLSGNPHTVIGIIDPSVDFQELAPDPEVWLAFQFDPNTKDQGHYFRVAARLAPDVSLEQANARLALSSKEYTTKFPNTLGQGAVFAAVPMREALVTQRPLVASGPRRRRQLRAPDRLRERRQPAAGARDRAAARDCRACRHRRGPRPYHAPVADRERRPVACRRRARDDSRHHRHPRAAHRQHGRPAAHRPGRVARGPRLACAALHARRVARHGHPLRPDSRHSRIAG